MLRTIAVAVSLLAAVPAVAQTMAPRSAEAPALASVGSGEVPNGFQLELNVFQIDSSYSADSLTGTVANGGGSSTSGSALITGLLGTTQPRVLAGYYFDQNALLLGLGIGSVGTGSLSNGGLFLGISPTFRRYFAPLRSGQVTGFAEVAATVSLYLPSGQGATNSFGLGVDGGAGAEWVFVKDFGLFAKATLGYSHVNISVSGGSGENIDGFALVGDVGLNVHL